MKKLLLHQQRQPLRCQLWSGGRSSSHRWPGSQLHPFRYCSSSSGGDIVAPPPPVQPLLVPSAPSLSAKAGDEQLLYSELQQLQQLREDHDMALRDAQEEEATEMETTEVEEELVPLATAGLVSAITSNQRCYPPSHRVAATTSGSTLPLPTEEGGSSIVKMDHWATSSAQDYLRRQDELYLSYPARVQLPLAPSPSTSSAGARGCVMVVFHVNDLRTQDHYALALACQRAMQGSGGGGALPVVAALVLDYRLFAQPSVVAGFCRQGPLRAQWLLAAVAALRIELEGRLHIPLLIRCGRPEEHIPRLAAELGAVDVFTTTQYAPHEGKCQRIIAAALKRGAWVHRTYEAISSGDTEEEVEEVVEHVGDHPYGGRRSVTSGSPLHLVWQSTLIHLDDLPRPLSAMREGERWYLNDIPVASVRPTAPYTQLVRRAADILPVWHTLLPDEEEQRQQGATPLYRGRLPTLSELGYGTLQQHVEELIGTDSAHGLNASEAAAHDHLAAWLQHDGLTSMLRLGRERRTNTKMYSDRLSRLSPYISLGILSPRSVYEAIRQHALDQQGDGFAQQQYQEALLRLSRRDFCHWSGLRYGSKLFFSYGPHPEDSSAVEGSYQVDERIINRWCRGYTGFPFTDAAARELLTTGFVANEGRQALAWLLTRGLQQDWRVAAEWFERTSLDFDPFICYYQTLRCAELLPDDLGSEPVRNLHYLAHHHDQSGIYVKKWIPALSKVPPVYIHRPHVMTPRMQAMHHVYLGRNYPHPIKLWDGAEVDLDLHTPEGAHQLGLYGDPMASSSGSTADVSSEGSVMSSGAAAAAAPVGFAEAFRGSSHVLPVEEWSLAVSPQYVARRAWQPYLSQLHAYALPPSSFRDDGGDGEAVAYARQSRVDVVKSQSAGLMR